MNRPPPRRIHIVGVSPRTGTTLLAECMVACMKIDAFEAHEAPLSRLRMGPGLYVTKRPVDLLSIGPRLRSDPNFHALCLIRDPRDVVVSRHGLDEGRYWSPLWIWKQRLAYVRAFARHERFVLLRYEDLVADPNGIQQRICARLPFLECVRPFSEFAAVAEPSGDSLRALGSLRAFDGASVGNWRKHLPRLAGQLAEHGPVTQELIEFGYERDDAWLSSLHGVAPASTPSHLADWPQLGVMQRYQQTLLPWMSLIALRAARAAGIAVA